jgi:cytochrome c-type biogenesis protein
MKQAQEVSVLIAFAAGFLSFVSPCVLPLVPSYITYITGASFHDLTDQETRKRVKWTTLIHSCLFILGFSTVFILMGASASYLGQILSKYQTWIMKIGGILIILLGIHFILQIFPFLQIEKRFEMKRKPMGYLGSFLVGIVFAAGWTPCIGPILSTILIYASTSQQMTTGIILLASYSLGLGIPFLLASLAFNLFLSTFEKVRRYMKVIIFISGFFLIGVGILLLTGTFRVVTEYFNFLASPD